MKKTLLFALFALLFMGNVHAEEAKAKHVIFIGLDGLGSYAMDKADMPNVRRLMADGSYTLEKRVIIPSMSAPNWASMFMGVGAESHGFYSNSGSVSYQPTFTNENGIFPTVFSQFRKKYPDGEMGCFMEWDGIRVLIDQKAFNKTQYVSYSKTGDQACAEAAAKYIREKKPNLFFIQLDQIDHVGHGDGHNTPAYYAALPVVDKQVGILMQAVADAGIWDEAVFVISSDHGGTGKGHGGISMEELRTPFIICGKGIQKGHQITEPMVQYDVAPTIARILGLDEPECWRGKAAKVFSEANADIHNYVNGICTDEDCKNPYEEPQLADGCYQLANAGNLIWFGKRVNFGFTDINAVMTADIDLEGTAWTPICERNATNPYKGTFDGQGHSILNFFCDAPAQEITGASFIGGLRGTLQNLSIHGKIVASGARNSVVGYADAQSLVSNVHSYLEIDATKMKSNDTGGVIGSLGVGAEVDRCSFSGTLTVSGNSYDGFGGVVGWTNSGRITNCANYGTLTCTGLAKCELGGIVGGVSSKDFYKFSHNLNVGSVTNTAANPLYTNALIGHLTKCNAENEIENNYFLAGSAAQGIGGSGAREEAISANNAQLSGGEITYLLNEGRTDSIVWYQTLGEDNWPVLFAGHKTVYKSENGMYHNGEDAINMQAADKTGKSSSATYTLKGQKVSQTTKNKDIYIVKGKKVLK